MLILLLKLTAIYVSIGIINAIVWFGAGYHRQWVKTTKFNYKVTEDGVDISSFVNEDLMANGLTIGRALAEIIHWPSSVIDKINWHRKFGSINKIDFHFISDEELYGRTVEPGQEWRCWNGSYYQIMHVAKKLNNLSRVYMTDRLQVQHTEWEKQIWIMQDANDNWWYDEPHEEDTLIVYAKAEEESRIWARPQTMFLGKRGNVKRFKLCKTVSLPWGAQITVFK